MSRSLAVVFTLLLLAPAPLALAQAESDDADRAAEEEIDLEKLAVLRAARQRSPDLQMRSRIQRHLLKSQELSDADKPQEALKVLGRLDLDRLNPLERAQVYKLFGYAAYTANDYQGSIEGFENAVAEEVLTLKDEVELRKSVAQLYTALFQWPEAIEATRRWIRYEPEPPPLSHYLLAIAYYQMDEYDVSIDYAIKAVESTPEPKESWLQLLAALYVKKQDYQKAAPVLEDLVMRFRKKEYWTQLALIYGALDDFQGSLAVQQIAYAQGFIDDDKTVRRLARGFLYNDLPFPAARVLEKALAEEKVEPDAEAYELLANSWIAAREYDKALEPLRQAAQRSETGNLYLRLGQVHMQREEWHLAVEMFQKALEKGGLREEGNVHLLLGISHYNDKKVSRARASFARARQHEATRTQADQWIDHLEKEAQQQAAG